MSKLYAAQQKYRERKKQRLEEAEARVSALEKENQELKTQMASMPSYRMRFEIAQRELDETREALRFLRLCLSATPCVSHIKNDSPNIDSPNTNDSPIGR